MTCTGLDDTQTALDTQPRGLCVRFPDGREQKLPMPQAKATLGAGAGCAVLIRHPGVDALHCLLFPAESGWRVRRWSDNTLLNGEAFTEAPVEAGDRLQLGPVEIEFLGELPERECDATAADAPVACGSSVAWTRNRRHRSAALDDRFHTVRTAFGETLTGHLCRLEELPQKLCETTESQQRWQQELGELREQLQDLRYELAHAEQLHLATREAIVELERQIADVRQSRTNGHSPRLGGFRRARRVLPAGLRQRLGSCVGRAAIERQATSDRESIERPPAEYTSPLASEEAASAYDANLWNPAQNDSSSQPLAVMPEPESDEGSLASESAEITEGSLFVAEPESDAPPVSFLDKYQSLQGKDEASVTESATEEIAKPSAAGRPAQEASTGAEEPRRSSKEHDDDSIESYMTRLLQRVRGEPHPEAAAIVPEISSHETFEARVPAEALPQSGVKPVIDLQEIKSAPAPERERNMAALRELANQSARKAIHSSELRNHREHALAKLLVSLLAFLCGLVVMTMSPSYASAEFIGGLVPMIAGLVWGSHTIVLLFYAIREGSFSGPFAPDHSNQSETSIPPDISADDL